MLHAATSSMPRFAADVMLGRLARWLRASGLDVHYDNRVSDDQLVQIFLKEKRWIVTRDSGLVRRRVLRRAIFIESEILEQQLGEFFEKTRFILDRNALRPFSRCIDCNEQLKPAAREQARVRVPPYVFQQHDIFKFCPKCHKIFWAGTHRDRIQALLNRSCPL
ncbi:MAG: Mut7-C RNAse domain-containing protein [Acidobacteria bacterium]|nr:Mut7-C RNAse domain-containing protein [Acidobacteriota bacterium]